LDPAVPPRRRSGTRTGRRTRSRSRADGLIYGVSSDAATVEQLVQVDATGTQTLLPVTLPTASAIGAFGADGFFYALNNTGTTMFRVNVTANTFTTIPLTGVVPAGIADFTLLGSYLWSQKPNSTFERIDPATGSVTEFPSTAVPANVATGGTWTYGNGNLGASQNTTGDIYQVRIDNPDSATPSFTLISKTSGPSTNGNDGTSCIGLPVDLAVTKSAPANVAPGAKITWTLTVHNFGPGVSSGYDVSDTVPASVTGVTAQQGCTVNANSVHCTGGPLQPGNDAVITLSGTAPPRLPRRSRTAPR
jgi:uncharacterized repeat protein (TIGR01451 family)